MARHYSCPYHPNEEAAVEKQDDGKYLVICPICGKLGKVE